MPAIIATPSSTAIAVSAERSLRVGRAPGGPEPITRQRLQVVEDLVLRRALVVVDDLAVGQEQDRVGDRRRARVVGDHHDRLAELVDGAAQQVEHVAAGVRVEVAGRLVGEHDAGPGDERARDRDALRLAAGQLARAVRAAVLEADRVDQRLEPLLVRLVAADPDRQQDVLLGVQDRQQVVALEDEADRAAPQQRQLAVAQLVEAGAVDLDPAARGACRARRGCASASTCRSRTGP